MREGSLLNNSAQVGQASEREGGGGVHFKVLLLLLLHLLTSLTEMFRLHYSRQHSLPCIFYPVDENNIASDYGERYCLIFQGHKDGCSQAELYSRIDAVKFKHVV